MSTAPHSGGLFADCPLIQNPVVTGALEVLWVKTAEQDPAPVELTVNKHLLAAISPFFHTLFFGPFAERKSNRFVLIEPRLDTLKTMFALLDPFVEEGDDGNGTPAVSVNRQNVADLYAISRQYQVPVVSKKCLCYLTSHGDCGEEDLLFKLKIAEQLELPEAIIGHCRQSLFVARRQAAEARQKEEAARQKAADARREAAKTRREAAKTRRDAAAVKNLTKLCQQIEAGRQKLAAANQNVVLAELKLKAHQLKTHQHQQGAGGSRGGNRNATDQGPH